MPKIINIKVEQYKQITQLCKELEIDPSYYDSIDKKLAGKLIFDLSHILLFKKGLLKNGAILAPSPTDYQRGGKYDVK